MDNKNWKVKNSTVDYQNDYFKIVKNDMIRPDGTTGTYYVVKRETAFFSIVIAVTPEDDTYLIGQYRIPSEVYSWEFPMGGVIGKNPLETAQQELIEETGMTAKTWKEIGWFYVANGHTNQKGYVFTAHDITEGKAQPEAGEFLEVKKVPIKQIGLMIKNGEITDGPTMTALQLYNLSRE